MRKNFFTLRTQSTGTGCRERLWSLPSLEIFKSCLETMLCNVLWVALLEEGVGLDYLQKSLPLSLFLCLNMMRKKCVKDSKSSQVKLRH